MSYWGEIVVPIAIGPIFLIGKYVWDLFYDRKEDIMRRKHEAQLETWEQQIKDFYWPFYLALVENQQLWKYVMEHHMLLKDNICKDDETDSSASETEAEDHNGSVLFIKHSETIQTLYPNKSFKINQCAYRYKNQSQCGVHLSVHQSRIFGPYCMAHFILQQRNAVKTMSWKTGSNHIVTTSDIPTSIQKSQQSFKQESIEVIYELFQKNHDKLDTIIREHLPIISSRCKLGKYMVQFQQYITAFQLVNQHLDTKGIHNPKDQGAVYPKRILPYLEKKLFQTQKLLFERTENFYKELDTNDHTKDPATTSYCSFCCGNRLCHSWFGC